MKILLGDKEYELEKLTLSQYKRVKELQNTGEQLTDVEYISLLTNIPQDEIKQATIPQINFVSKVLNSLYTNTTNKEQVRQLVEYKGEVLGLITPSQMTYGEWTDLEVLTAQDPLNLSHIAAILYRPCETYNVETLDKKIVKYNYEECVERSNDMDDFPVDYIFSALFFFIKYAEILMNRHHSFLEGEAKMMTELNRQMKERKKKS
jgi:hypothetical protein